MGRPKDVIRAENINRERNHVWDSWEWLIEDKFDGAYRAIGQAITDMTLCGSSKKDAIEFIKPRLDKLLDQWR